MLIVFVINLSLMLGKLWKFCLHNQIKYIVKTT